MLDDAGYSSCLVIWLSGARQWRVIVILSLCGRLNSNREFQGQFIVYYYVIYLMVVVGVRASFESVDVSKSLWGLLSSHFVHPKVRSLHSLMVPPRLVQRWLRPHALWGEARAGTR